MKFKTILKLNANKIARFKTCRMKLLKGKCISPEWIIQKEWLRNQWNKHHFKKLEREQQNKLKESIWKKRINKETNKIWSKHNEKNKRAQIWFSWKANKTDKWLSQWIMQKREDANRQCLQCKEMASLSL